MDFLGDEGHGSRQLGEDEQEYQDENRTKETDKYDPDFMRKQRKQIISSNKNAKYDVDDITQSNNGTANVKKITFSSRVFNMLLSYNSEYCLDF